MEVVGRVKVEGAVVVERLVVPIRPDVGQETLHLTGIDMEAE